MEMVEKRLFILQSNYFNQEGFYIYQSFLSLIPKNTLLVFCLFSANDREAVFYALSLGFTVTLYIPYGDYFFRKNKENLKLLRKEFKDQIKILSLCASGTSYSSVTVDHTINYILKNTDYIFFMYGEIDSNVANIAKSALDSELMVFSFPGNIFSNAFLANNFILKYGAGMLISDLDIRDILPSN